MIARFLVILGLAAWCQTAYGLSWFEKVALLRFGNEIPYLSQDGEVDLSHLSPESYFHVQGDILFFPDEFLQPRYLTAQEYLQLVGDKKPVKATLNRKSYPQNLNKTKANQGTFLIRFVNAEPGKLLNIIPARYYHPIRLYYANGKQGAQLLLEQGSLETAPSVMTNENNLNAPIPDVVAGRDFYLYAHVRSPLRNGENTLNFSSFYVGHQSYLTETYLTTRYYARAISGGFFIMALFYNFIFLFRRQDRSSLYVALYAFSCFLLSLIYTWNLGMSISSMLNSFTVINLAGIAALQHYLLDKLKFRFSERWVKRLKLAAKIAFVVAALSVFLSISLLVALTFLIGFISSTVLTFSMVYLGIKYKLNGIVYFCIGTTLNCAFQFPIMISYIGGSNQENGYYILLASFAMAISLALVNAKEFAVTYRRSVRQGRMLEEKNKEIMDFNKNLEKMVADKTQEIRVLLDYIPQGVLSLVEDGLIANDYSSHLTNIVEIESLGGLCFCEHILKRCDLSSDARDQTWQAILSIIGESEFNFEANADKLPRELTYHAQSGEKILSVTWNIQLDELGDVQRILVTLLDVTAEKALEKEALKQRQEIDKIQQLLAIPAAKVAQFFSTSLPLLEENQHIISAHDHSFADSVMRTLFVNAHTVKGAARTLQLKDLTSSIHDMEESYSQVLRHGMAPDQEKMLADIDHVLSVFDDYMTINREKLNRTEDYSKVAIERDFIEHHYQMLKNLTDAPSVDVKEIIKALREQSESLTKMIFEQLPTLFETYQERAYKIAADVGKPKPVFDADLDDVSISPDRKVVLDNCMIHILRNILDHGIESAEERRLAGKDESGYIWISGQEDHDVLRLKIKDDGRGLAIARLRAKGLEQGKLTEQSSLDQIAELIFESGISTAKNLSDISGRGVGMNAVRTFLERSGGRIRLALEEPKDESGQFYDFHFEILLPLHPGTHEDVA